MTNPPGAMPPLPEPDHKRELNRLLNKFFVACTFGDDNTKRMAVGKELHEFVDGVAAPLIARVAELQAALQDAVTRMDRARDILTDGKPTPQCNWGMLDTNTLRAAIAAKD